MVTSSSTDERDAEIASLVRSPRPSGELVAEYPGLNDLAKENADLDVDNLPIGVTVQSRAPFCFCPAAVIRYNIKEKFLMYFNRSRKDFP